MTYAILLKKVYKHIISRFEGEIALTCAPLETTDEKILGYTAFSICYKLDIINKNRK